MTMMEKHQLLENKWVSQVENGGKVLPQKDVKNEGCSG
jgi:hypothetical protein